MEESQVKKSVWGASPQELYGAGGAMEDKSNPLIGEGGSRLTTTQGGRKATFDVPQEVEDLIKVMDFSTDGEPDLDQIQLDAEHLKQLRQHVGDDPEKFKEALKLIDRQMRDKSNNSDKIEYSHMPEQIKKVLKNWDVDNSGHVDAKALGAVAVAYEKMQKEGAVMKKCLLGAVAIITLMFFGMFAMGMVTAELAKEFKANDGDPSMVTKSGQTVQVASVETIIDENGIVRMRQARDGQNQSGRILAAQAAPATATQTVKEKRVLRSTQSNSFFDSLAEISVHSEKGHVLNLKITGYARVPLRNSRCGNVVKLFASGDGHVSLDSADLSFSGHLEELFKTAGFEVAVGGSAGRRLAGVTSVDGFFHHVSQMGSEGSWKCGDIPLPHMPTNHIKKFDSYTPCIEPSLDVSNTQTMSSCDSTYGGTIVGTTKLPAAHVSATLSRLDQVQDTLINGKVKNPTANKLYSKTSEYSMVSPAYTVQRTHNEMHPAQTLIRVTDLTIKKSVEFQQMHAGQDEQAIRNFCKEGNVVDPVLKEKEAHKDASTDTSVHFEYVGLEGEGDKIYRRFRMVPSKDFSVWMGSEGVGNIPSTVYHYWDDAESDLFTPYRLVTPGGDVVVYTEMSQTATDADVEAFLKNTVNATKFGIFTKPYKFDCDESERGPKSAEFGEVPQMNTGELTTDDINFYARYLFDAASHGELSDGMDSGDAQSLAQAVRNHNSTTALLTPAYTFLETVAKTSSSYDFAQHALLAHGKLSMASACSNPCAAERNAVQDHMTEKGNGAMCSAPHLKPLAECLENLDPQIRVYCIQSVFWQTYQADCFVVGPSRRLQQSQAQMRVLPDGTHSLDLSSLDKQTRKHLSGALSASQEDASLGDLKGYRVLLYNASNMENPTPNALVSDWESDSSPVSSRRLVGFSDCSDWKVPGYCIAFTFPKPGNWRCSSACGNGVPPMDPTRCEKNIVDHCKLALKVKVTPPGFVWRSSSGGGTNGVGVTWTVGIELGGSIAMLEVMFGLFHPPSPLYGDATMAGGISFNSAHACPDVHFSLEGYASIGFNAGVGFWGIKLDLFTLSLKIGAKITKVAAWGWWYRTDRRRGWDWRRRRRSRWAYAYRPLQCDVEVYAKVEIFIALIKGWMFVLYTLFSKQMKINLGVKLHVNLWVTSYCKDVWSQDVLNTNLR